MIVKAGFAASDVGKIELARTYKFSILWLRPLGLTTDSLRRHHAAGADLVRHAVRGPAIDRTGSVLDGVQLLMHVIHPSNFIVARSEVDARFRQAARVQLA